MLGLKLHVVFLVAIAAVLALHVADAAPGRGNERGNGGGNSGGNSGNRPDANDADTTTARPRGRRPNHKEEQEKRKVGKGRVHKGNWKKGHREQVEDRYIIKYKKGKSFSDRERPLRGPKGKGKKTKAFKHLRFGKIVGKLDADDLAALRADPDVEAVILDEKAEIFCSYGYTHPDAWGADLLDGYRDYRLRNNVTKQASLDNSTVIYVIDTGVYSTHTEFKKNSTYSRASKLDWVFAEAWMHPHGTAAADVAAGRWRGADTTALIKDLRVMDNYGLGFNSDIVDAIDTALTDHISRGTNAKSVINMSLGSGTTETIIDEACEEAVAGGMIVVSASGNYGVNAEAFSPCRSPSVICVGAVDEAGQVPFWSNYGPTVDIAAAGVEIPTASSEGSTEYLLMSGTSFACPLVSGVISAYLASNPGTPANVTDVREYLMKYASRTATFTGLEANTFGVDTSVTEITNTTTTTASTGPTTATTVATGTTTAAPVPTTNAILRVGLC